MRYLVGLFERLEGTRLTLAWVDAEITLRTPLAVVAGLGAD